MPFAELTQMPWLPPWWWRKQPRQVTRITAGDFMQPAVSPGGHRIAYWALPVTSEAPLRFSANSRDIWTIRPDGTDPVRVTSDAATDWSPAWSPDGRFLYFASDRRGSMNLWSTRSPGSRARSLPAPGEFLGDPQLSRDNRQLYFTHGMTGADIWMMTFK